MKAKELIEILSQDPEREVIMSSDSEGNYMSPLSEVLVDCVYLDYTGYGGDVYRTEYTHDDMDMEIKEWEKIKSMPKVFTLYPIR